MGGLFISLEGIEGTGKTTQSRLLGEALEAQGQKTVLTVEPGGTEISRHIREVLLDVRHTNMDPMTELLLYAAARRQHLQEIINPALKRGEIVITDRFSDSTMAYQGYARGLDRNLIRSLDSTVTGSIRPNLTLLLDMDPRIGLERNRNAQKVDRLELEALEFHQKVRDGFLQIATQEPDRIKIINAETTVEQIHTQILEKVNRLTTTNL
ncbi:dTMP kinase [Nitrospirota bacterium]